MNWKYDSEDGILPGLPRPINWEAHSGGPIMSPEHAALWNSMAEVEDQIWDVAMRSMLNPSMYPATVRTAKASFVRRVWVRFRNWIDYRLDT